MLRSALAPVAVQSSSSFRSLQGDAGKSKYPASPFRSLHSSKRSPPGCPTRRPRIRFAVGKERLNTPITGGSLRQIQRARARTSAQFAAVHYPYSWRGIKPRKTQVDQSRLPSGRRRASFLSAHFLYKRLGSVWCACGSLRSHQYARLAPPLAPAKNASPHHAQNRHKLKDTIASTAAFRGRVSGVRLSCLLADAGR
jgi:hypothetical protein